jgi:hypothetical protein
MLCFTVLAAQSEIFTPALVDELLGVFIGGF